MRGFVERFGKRYYCDAASGVIGGESKTVVNLAKAGRGEWEDVVRRPKGLIPTLEDFEGVAKRDLVVLGADTRV